MSPRRPTDGPPDGGNEPDGGKASPNLLDREGMPKGTQEMPKGTQLVESSFVSFAAALWLLAQALSEVLPDGDKVRQWLRGLLNQKDRLDEARGRLF
jgi:hypothetical protein